VDYGGEDEDQTAYRKKSAGESNLPPLQGLLYDGDAENKVREGVQVQGMRQGHQGQKVLPFLRLRQPLLPCLPLNSVVFSLRMTLLI